MKSIALTLSLVAGALTLTPVVATQQADACAMRKVRVPPTGEQMLSKAKRAEEAKETRKAIRLYERLMNAKGYDEALRGDAAFAAARLHAELDHQDKALARLQRATELAPRRAELWAAYSALQAKAGQLDGARAALEKARSLGADAASLETAGAVLKAHSLQTAQVDDRL